MPSGADIDALAAYVSSVQFGMSVRARDGAGRAELSAVVDAAMAGSEYTTRALA